MINKVEMENINTKKEIAKQLYEEQQLEAVNLFAGNGGFGDVMIVKQMKPKEYAVKIISIFDGIGSVSQYKLTEAKKEANILKNCSHPNIVKYKNQFQIGNNYFILMEKCEMSLLEVIHLEKHKNITRTKYISFALQTLEAIQYVHSKNFVFRDISLNNILLDSNEKIKLCDFGLAKQIDPSLLSRQQALSEIKGNIFYFPPEILERLNKNVRRLVYQNVAGDIWAFGICFYLLAGANFLQVNQFAQGQFSFQIQKSIDSDINQILLDILQKDPKSRPAIPKIIDSFKSLQQQPEIESSQYSLIINQNKKQIFSIKPQQEGLIYYRSLQKNGRFIQYLLPIMLLIIIFWLFPFSQKLNLHNNQGDVYYNKQMYKKAITSYKQLIQSNPKNDILHYNLGKSYYHEQFYDESITSLKLAIIISPTNDIYHNNLGLSYSKKQMYNEAIESYKFAIHINPKNDTIHFNLGHSYQNKQMYSEAITSYKLAIEINSKDDNYYNNLGLSYYYKQMYNEAIISFKLAIEINPQKDIMHYQLGGVYYNKQMYNEAITSYKQAIEINPKDDNYYNNLGLSYIKKQMYNEAIKSYKLAILINPNNKEYRDNFNQVCEKFKNC